MDIDFEQASALFAKLTKTIKALRTPGSGCPWDLEQDHHSLRPYLLEEAYEVLQTIDDGDDTAFCDELGDLLLQVVLHAQVAADRDAFKIEDVIRAIDDKMIRRHPHVFGSVSAETSEQVLKNWEALKVEEKKQRKGAYDSLPITGKLQDIPPALPALVRAQRIGEKVAKFNFDWSSIEGVLSKVREEIAELEAEIRPVVAAGETGKPRQVVSVEQRKKLEHELGDVLFSVCQLSRWLGLHAEDSLREASSRFISRFTEMEREIGTNIESMSEDELEAAWQKAKKSQAVR